MNAVMKNVNELFDGACKDMDEALKADVKAEEDMIAQVISQSSGDAAAKKRQVSERADCVKRIKNIEAQVFTLCSGYGFDEDFTKLKA